MKGTYQDPLINVYNLNYLGELYMGSDEQKFTVVWDTGSGSLLLKSSLCDDCLGDVFQTGDSSSFAYYSPEGEAYDTTTYLDGTTLYGRWAKDTACPVSGSANGCAVAFEFVAIVTASGLSNYESGLLGMGSGNHASATQSEMFMVQMAADSDITE